MGGDDIWDLATTALEGALERKGWKYAVDEGGGAFYGPKIDLKIRDAIGRTWQCSTVQCDFNLPERFDLEYKSAEGTMERPIMIHRAIFGSIERFFGILVENCAGDFPLWLAPTQLKLLPVTESVQDYCYEVKKKAEKVRLDEERSDELTVSKIKVILTNYPNPLCSPLRSSHPSQMGLRVEIDSGKDRLPKQVRNAEKSKIPLMAIVGVKELESNELSIRSKAAGDLGSFDVDEFLAGISHAIAATEEFTTTGTLPPPKEPESSQE